MAICCERWQARFDGTGYVFDAEDSGWRERGCDGVLGPG